MKRFEEIVKEIEENREAMKSSDAGNMKYAILIDNAKVAMFHEAIPILLSVLKKYNKKQMGEKTCEKAENEFLELTNGRFRFYFDNKGISITPKGFYSNNFTITVGLKVDDTSYMTEAPTFLKGNKLNTTDVTVNDIELWYMRDEYIEDIENRIEQLFKLKKEAAEIQDKLRVVCGEYNHLIPSRFKPLDWYNYIYKN